MDQSLVSVMRNINEALRLDDDSHDKEAYLKYLDCVLCITCNLQQNVRAMGGDVVITKEVTKQVKLTQQCVERVAVLVERIGSTQRPVVLTSPQEESSFSGQLMAPRPRLFMVVPPLPAESTANTFARVKVNTPMEVALKQNQQLMAAYKARLKRMNKRDPGAFNLSLTIQRKMAENLAIGQRTEMALAKKMQERQERLEEQAAKRFATPIGMSEEEQEQRQIYKKILEYEQDAKWLQDWRGRLSARSQEPELICQLIQEILRCRDHPLTLLLKQYQYKVYEKLYPIVANKRQRLEVVTVPLDRALWPPDLCPSPGKERTLTGGVEEDKGDEVEGAGLEEEDEGIQTDQDPSSRSPSTEDSPPADHPSMPCSSISADPGLSPAEPQDSGGPRCVPGADSEIGSGDSLSDSRMKPTDNSGEGSTHTVCQKEGSLLENPGEAGLKTDLSNSEAVSPLHLDSMTGEVKEGDSDPDNMETTADSQDSPNGATDKDGEMFRMPSAETGEETAGLSEHWEGSSLAEAAEDSKEALSRAISNGEQLQSQLITQQERAATILRQVSQDYESYNAENMDDLFDDEDDQAEEDRNTDDSLPEHRSTDAQSCPNPAEFKNSMSVTSQSSSGDWDRVDFGNGSVSSAQDFPSLPAAVVGEREEEVERLSKEAYQRHLKNISADVHMYMEKLLILFTIAYEQLDSPQGRDQCYASLEETFFKPLWKFLLMLFRLAHYQEELTMACKMTQRGGGGPREMGVTNKLCLTPAAPSGGGGRKVKDVDPAGSPAGGDGSEVRPYSKAISHLACLQHHYTMLSKLECVVKVVHLIFDCIKEFYVGQGYPPSDVPSVGADDLLPVMSYVVMQSRLPQLVSECQAMAEFIHEGYMMGQEGYCLTTLETAVSFIVSADLQEPISPS